MNNPPQIQTILQNSDINLTSVLQDVPQLQTVMQDGLPPVTTIVNAPWVQVTSVNGMTGDVIVEISLSEFEPNHYYPKNTVIIYNGSLYYSKADFTSGTSFNQNDWNAPQFSQIQTDWNTTAQTESSYIKNKPTKLSQFANDSGFITSDAVTPIVENALKPIDTELNNVYTKVDSLETTINDVTTDVNVLGQSVEQLSSNLDAKVDKEDGKSLSSNDFTDAYKELLDNIKTTILNQTYPIGSIFVSTTISTATAVGETLGGTWEAYSAGRVLVGKSTSSPFNVIGSTGGSRAQELRAAIGAVGGDIGAIGYETADPIPGTYPGYSLSCGVKLNASFNHSTPVYTTDGSIPSTLQPYIVVYMYRRTA